MTEKLLPSDLTFSGPFPRLSRRLRLGIVGGGRISVTQSTAARLSDYWEIKAGALSSDPVKAKAKGQQWYLDDDRCYSSFEEMANKESERDDGIDAVMITTPNHLHFDAAKVFLEAGIDVLCDKPLTNEIDQAVELIRLTQQTGMVFGVSFVNTAFPMIRQAKAMVERGDIGKINQVHVEFMQDWMMNEDISQAEHVKWRLDPKKSGSTSCTGDIGTHAQNLATFVTGLPMTDILAQMHVCGAPKALEDTVIMMTKYDNAIPGTLMATRLASGNRGGLRLRVYGDKGGIEWDMEYPERLKYSKFGEADRVLTRGQGGELFPQVERSTRLARGFSEGVLEAWANLYTEFALAVAARKDGLDTPCDWLQFPRVESGAAGVRFSDATVESHQQGGQWVNCELKL
ncbi:Gfo/Idh/MocA family oxidoreductase [Vibrio coralliilyticus]|uniref:Gfo/Idh/MocA family protein n=1 Tax=Vibrio coralliilyticus TaxID=190893 RepID=UPI001560802C|nr:Gfo/Idh/MocA family oxidoreductase [Vibrio coralliilyticus]NRF23402.1 Gfo/Idh/MocA family oxidoreductase [Vibrio coralliilyticus]NRF77888.1 Gfo/Idh/MocA family oxidoreductase [Vibrio coralliilyticus]